MVSAPGIGSGLDIAGLVQQLVTAERKPVANRIGLAEARTNTELSALGKLKSAVTTFRTALEPLTALETFQPRKVTLDSDELLSVTATSSAVQGSYDIEVEALASAQKLASPAFADPAVAVGTGTLSLSVNGVTSALAFVDGANSLEDIRDAINAAPDNPGVTATIVVADDGARLILSAAETGAANAITVTTSGGDGGLSVFDYDALAAENSMTEIRAAADASVRIDGFLVSSAGNSISSAVEGLTINLQAAEPGTVTRVRVGFDQAAANEALQQFVTAFNGLVGTIDEVTAFNAETGVAAALLGDSIIRDLQTSLRRELSAVVRQTDVPFSMLAEIGITSDLDGKLAIDSARTADAIEADFDAVGRLFAREDDGIAVRVDAVLARLLDDSGAIDLREDRLKDRLSDLTEQRERLDERMVQVEARYTQQFQAMDLLLSQLRSTSDRLTQQLAGLPGFTREGSSS